MAFWIFKCNPQRYDLESRLNDPNNAITWTVAQYEDEIGPGDTAFLWLTGPNRGIRATLRVDEAPRLQPEMKSEQQYWKRSDTEEKLRVICTLTHRGIELDHNQLREIHGLEHLSVFQGFQQKTNFPVTPAEGDILLRLINKSVSL